LAIEAVKLESFKQGDRNMAGRLAGKTAFCTAAGQGIGRAVVEAFAAEGARVIASDVNEKLLTGFPAGVIAKRLDVLDDQAIATLAKETGPVDILFNCAGFVHHGSALEATDKDWDFAFNLNVRSQWKMITAFLPGMLDKFEKTGHSSSIINIASVCGSVKGLPNRFIYGTTKAAVVGLTKSVAADYVKRGVRCNAIGPGTVDTPSLGDRINAFADPVQARKDFIARQPMGRLAQAHEIAPLAVYLASDESIFATGNIFMCDGGMTI
jgi:2-keto-3-deoxy-L-fuconate dehydrogenase